MIQDVTVTQTEGAAPDDRFFSTFAEATANNGYSVIAIIPRKKMPRFELEWRASCWTQTSLEWIRDVVETNPDSGVALACGRYTVAFDIDVDNEATVEILRSTVEDVCGKTPLVRIGNAPRIALFYRPAEPIISIRLPKFDTLGLGTNMTIYGIHPRLEQPYRWVGGAAPHLTKLNDLPAVTNDQCIEVATRVMRKVVGDRFERFNFDTDRNLLARSVTSRSILIRQLVVRVLRGRKHAQASYEKLLWEGKFPPGFWGFLMRPVVKGGFDRFEFSRKLDACQLD
ncbi:MAG: bifunctional DNA primase/polymerase [Pseudomonadota bacterium]